MIFAGIVLIVIGSAILFQTYRRYQQPERPSRAGVLTRLGTLMLGIFVLAVGVMMVLPADEATPTPESRTSPAQQVAGAGSQLHLEVMS